MIAINHNTAQLTAMFKTYCKNIIDQKGYITLGYEKEIENHTEHHASFVRHNGNDEDYFNHSVKALDKLLFEINKVAVSDNFDSEFASSSWIGC
jgi:hypothetical protein